MQCSAAQIKSLIGGIELNGSEKEKERENKSQMAIPAAAAEALCLIIAEPFAVFPENSGKLFVGVSTGGNWPSVQTEGSKKEESQQA